MINSRLLIVGMAGAVFSVPLYGKSQVDKENPLNVLLITADDLNWNSVGFRGCSVPDITPNIDRLARQGMIFENGHVTCAISMPSRGALMTGMYPHASGVTGFTQSDKNVTTFQEVMSANGYAIAVYGKCAHSTPTPNVRWDEELVPGMGRSPKLYASLIKNFIRKNQKEGKPFFIMANSQDPHRPFSGSEAEARKFKPGTYEQPSRTYSEQEIEVPGFLPDLPMVRKEISQYFSSVKRLDDMVGAVLQAIDECGVRDNTLIVFLSDNGMSQPFAKTNCYLNSTRSPWIVYLPGVTSAGSVNHEALISGVDFMPTVLDILKIPIPETVQGRTILPLLKGEKQKDREYVYTEINENFRKRTYPIRAVHDKDFVYIFNAWSVAGREFTSETQVGLGYKAMVSAAKEDSTIAARLRFFLYRTPEELYDLKNDPEALHNLIDDPVYAAKVTQLQRKMEEFMIDTDDPVLEAFLKRADPAALDQYMKKEETAMEEKKKIPSIPDF